MLSFVAEFPVDPDQTAQAFLESAKAWILDSPHTSFKDADLEALILGGEFEASRGPQKLYSISQTGATDVVALRLTAIDLDISWSSEVVFSRDNADCWVGIRTSREAFQPATRLPAARKPVVVRTMLKNLGGGFDGELKVSDEPYILRDIEVDRAARLIFGDAGCWLPVVYVSAPFANAAPLDARELARGLAGMAHVVIEPNRAFSSRLQVAVDSENVYGGVVGIYWPDSAGRRSYFFPGDFANYREFRKSIVDEVRSALLNRRPLQRCTFSAAQEARSKAAIDLLRAAGSKEVSKYAKAFDQELSAKEKRLQDSEAEIDRLKRELQSNKGNSRSVGSGVLLKTGSERDFFQGELTEFILDAIERAAANEHDGGRRKHVLQVVLSENQRGSKISDHKEKLKNCLRNYNSMTKPIRSALQDLGFEISEDGKHYKLMYHDDPQYIFSLAKTPSDHRNGLNSASDIGKNIF